MVLADALNRYEPTFGRLGGQKNRMFWPWFLALKKWPLKNFFRLLA
jgi:hypothetical protein